MINHEFTVHGHIMLEVRLHGRGGQGAVTSAELVANAAITEGKFAQAFPSFGPERRGAPVVAFVRVDDKRIYIRSKIYNPNIAIVLDPSLLDILDPSEGLKEGAILVINSKDSIENLKKKYGYTCNIAVIDASIIAKEELGLPIYNTTMLGALVKATGIVKLESLIEPFKERFGRVAEKNINALKRAYNETVMGE